MGVAAAEGVDILFRNSFYDAWYSLLDENQNPHPVSEKLRKLCVNGGLHNDNELKFFLNTSVLITSLILLTGLLVDFAAQAANGSNSFKRDFRRRIKWKNQVWIWRRKSQILRSLCQVR